jgi:hypothetical protein
MEMPQISPDDVYDVTEMAEKIEDHIYKVLMGVDLHIAISALIGAATSCFVSQFDEREEAEAYAKAFAQELAFGVSLLKNR